MDNENGITKYEFINDIIENIENKIYRIKQSIRFFFQRLRWGFDDSVTWSLDYEIAKFVLPRLKRFQELSRNNPLFGVPMLGEENLYNDEEFEKNVKEWDEIMSKMIIAFDGIVNESKFWDSIPENQIDVRKEQEEFYRIRDEGLDLFRKYFQNLWW